MLIDVLKIFENDFSYYLKVIISYIVIFQTICAQCDKDPCCDWVGEEGAGHFVKMVHVTFVRILF